MTVCETEEFLARAEKIWSAEERGEFVDFMFAKNQKSDLTADDKKALAEFAKLVKARIKAQRDAQDWKN